MLWGVFQRKVWEVVWGVLTGSSRVLRRASWGGALGRARECFWAALGDVSVGCFRGASEMLGGMFCGVFWGCLGGFMGVMLPSK